jgi:hypothetical protein
MRGIEQRNGCVFYYGNPAGYIDRDVAVMDAMFQNDELERWLTRNQLNAQWTNGVYERIADGNVPTYSDKAMPVLKNCRIWQLKPGAAAWKDIVTFGRPLPEPKMEDYAVVYDGQLDTNDLEAIYDKFTERRGKGSCPSSAVALVSDHVMDFAYFVVAATGTVVSVWAVTGSSNDTCAFG